MFVNCPFCRGLVATDPVTDLPPERCPRCAAQLRGAPGAALREPADDARSGVAAAMAEAFGNLDDAVDGGGAADPAADRAAQPAISIANLLQDTPAPVIVVAEPATVDPASRDSVVADPANADPALAGSTTAAVAPAALASHADGSDGAGSSPVGPPATEPVASAPAARSVSVPEAPPVHGETPAHTPTAPTTATATTGTAPRPRRTAPSFARGRTPGSADAPTGRRGWLPAAITALALLLGLQWLLADRARLAADPGWRPLVAGACSVLRCSLPPWREPAAFALLERDVRPHPGTPGALRIVASFRNQAAWAQPWPEVVLTLSDIDGRPLGARAFLPAEYLGGEPPAALLESGEGAVIRMDVLEPAPGAVGFSFDFR
ncbi:DUF3426 domain-containing protein [Luteimonas sp. MC1750]|uniref:DUF3426 domain-containing protein n=1 Tax=Luteimonas sp. MC1750 TaxID=2799326 RepID=UPI0018F0E2E4|nr:DUF3426 domain-containing protein [Luteimonas sp. MC1750]MBJ6983396.1 DUF3426 domain-containing protein [Luteimonas sp. MC1750]QQO06249.1 DUF3426 domain-containing protein [Luteimonas sp. MC1750]